MSTTASVQAYDVGDTVQLIGKLTLPDPLPDDNEVAFTLDAPAGVGGDGAAVSAETVSYVYDTDVELVLGQLDTDGVTVIPADPGSVIEAGVNWFYVEYHIDRHSVSPHRYVWEHTDEAEEHRFTTRRPTVARALPIPT